MESGKAALKEAADQRERVQGELRDAESALGQRGDVQPRRSKPGGQAHGNAFPARQEAEMDALAEALDRRSAPAPCGRLEEAALRERDRLAALDKRILEQAAAVERAETAQQEAKEREAQAQAQQDRLEDLGRKRDRLAEALPLFAAIARRSRS